MDVAQYLKQECPYLTDEHIAALLQFRRVIYPKPEGSAMVVHRSPGQETYQRPLAIMKWQGEVGNRRGRLLNGFELLLLAESIKH